MAAAAAASPATAPSSFPSARAHKPTLLSLRVSTKLRPSAAAASAASDPAPAFRSVTAFAPATVANLGPGFDFLGCAVADASLSLGDTVTATLDPSLPAGAVAISCITSPSRPRLADRLSRDPLRNCAGIAAVAALRALGVRSHGVSLSLTKGLPLGSGLGSSAASAAAAAKAVDALFGSLLPRDGLVLAGLESEKAVSGFHADNIAPAILGGFVMVRSYDPFCLVSLPCPPALRLCFVLVTPDFEAPTSKMRAALPKNIAMGHHVRNSSQAAALVAGVLQGDAALIGSAMSSDFIVEPTRAPLIPGMAAVKAAALEAGALGCTISGAGPTAVAVIEGEEKGEEVARRMIDAFLSVGKLKATATVAQLDRAGARVISTSNLE
ncbi:homoserine kinase [Aegilops tauschii subsp. strangulata]|uniref:homoserine kinase n=1 Tax=Aegilops tauschii subsp. strangulata TaxID=200361 RepID=UPI00098AE389|nr:LOW QUALITY PROTEIN: homoserine kinase [Aegilops tauschii subsp. strangulata]